MQAWWPQSRCLKDNSSFLTDDPVHKSLQGVNNSLSSHGNVPEILSFPYALLSLIPPLILLLPSPLHSSPFPHSFGEKEGESEGETDVTFTL